MNVQFRMLVGAQVPRMATNPLAKVRFFYQICKINYKKIQKNAKTFARMGKK